MDENALYKLSYGLFVLTATDEKKDNGCIINTAMQAAVLPNQLSICVSKENYTHDIILNSEKFTISIISENADFELFKHFGFQSGKNVDKFANYINCTRGKNGIYHITDGTNAYIDAKSEKTIDLGSHTLFVGEITDAKILSEIPSATYDYYHKNIKPKPSKTTSNKTIWRCRICGYEYEGNVLPDDFICPLCKHPASDFEKISG